MKKERTHGEEVEAKDGDHNKLVLQRAFLKPCIYLISSSCSNDVLFLTIHFQSTPVPRGEKVEYVFDGS